MLIDMHAHTSGISRCCRVAAPEILNKAKEAGLDGIVLTNHYQRAYVEDGDFRAFAERYVREFQYTEGLAKQYGLKVFFGIEVTMDSDPGLHLLIYGVKEDFILNNPTIFELTQEELYRLVRENGGALVQAHPYRRDVDRLLDTSMLDGIEISCHPLYEGTHISELMPIAYDAGIVLTVGGDYHADTRRPRCGVYLPDNLTGIGISSFLRETDEVKLLINEVDTTDTYELTFKRKKNGE